MPYGAIGPYGSTGAYGSRGRFGVGAYGIPPQLCVGALTISPGALSYTIGLAAYASVLVDWGDGTTTAVSYTGSTYQYYTKTYASAGAYTIRIIGSVKSLRLIDARLAMSITGMALTYLYLVNTGSSVTGVITGMALTYLLLINTGSSVTGVITGMALTFLYLYNTGSSVTGVITGMALTYLLLANTGSSVTGVITGMALTFLYLGSTGSSVTGVITGMALTYLLLGNTESSVTGALNSASRLAREYIITTNDITLPDNRIYETWGLEAMRIEMGTKLTSTQTDATLIRLAAATISGANKTYYIKGAARTSASDAAVATLTSAGVTGTITG